MHGGDHLGHGTHAHEVRAHRAQHAVFGACFEIRARHRDVDPFPQHDLVVERDRVRESAQLGIVRGGHIREARSLRVDVRPNQRIVAEQVDMIGDQHEVAGHPQWMHAARDVRHDQRLCPERLQDANRKRDLLQRVALVAMEAPLHHRDPPAAECPKQQTTRMGLHGRRRKARHVRIRNRRVSAELVGERAQSGTENDGDFWNDCSPRLDGADRV